jgi:hypothetical protein
MRLFLKILPFACVAILSSPTQAASKEEKKSAAPEHAAKDKKKPKAPAADGSEKTLNLPIPKEHPQKGVKLPLYNSDGKLRMYFTIGTATRVNDQDINMKDLNIQSFGDDGAMDLDMDFADAVMNVKTGEIATDTHVTIRRSDFEISGNRMIYNTNTKAGTLANGVRMLIYNLAALGKSDQEPTEEKKLSVEVKPLPDK